jgi:hexosaminidase
MFKKLSTSLLIVLAYVLYSCTSAVRQEIAILPTPVNLMEQSVSFVFRDEIPAYREKDCEAC